MVQMLTFLSLAPSMALLKLTPWEHLREAVASQAVVLQFIEIMFLTDLVQYWLHRVFHRVPWLWKFHSVHHSAQMMDWLAGSRHARHRDHHPARRHDHPGVRSRLR